MEGGRAHRDVAGYGLTRLGAATPAFSAIFYRGRKNHTLKSRKESLYLMLLLFLLL